MSVNLHRRRTRPGRVEAAGCCCLLALAATVGCPPLSAAPRATTSVGECRLEGPVELAGLLESLARSAAPALTKVQEELGVSARAPYTLVLVPADPSVDPEIARLDSLAPAWAGGYLIPTWRVGGIRLARADRYPYDGSLSVLVHEATHMLLHDAARGGLPRWFEEGVATWVDRQWSLRDGLLLTSAMWAHDLPPLASLDAAFVRSEPEARLAYAASFDFVAWSVARFGVDLPARLLVGMQKTRGFEAAWREATGESLAEAEAAWRRRRLRLSRWLPLVTASSTLWIGITLLALLAIWRRRRLDRLTALRWEQAEAAMADRTGIAIERDTGPAAGGGPN